MSRLASGFATPDGARRARLVIYVTAGDPDHEASLEVVRGALRGGADVIELGVPFSDPIADGPSIQRATERALAAGGTLRRTLDMVRTLRRETDVPIVLFTYVNPVMRMGLETFAEAAAAAGVDGVLLLDLPIEEGEASRTLLVARGIDPIFLVSPTTSDARLREAARLGGGFLYAISRLGVTGARRAVAESAEPLVARIRRESRLPVALGFGVSTPDQVAEVARFADGVVVGSAVVDVVGAAAAEGRPPGSAVEAFVRELAAPLRR